MTLRATLTLTREELNEAVAQWLTARGVFIGDRFCVTVATTQGDRPFDPSYTEITVTGVRVGAP